MDNLQTSTLIIQPSHPYLVPSLLLFNTFSQNGWMLNEQSIDPTGKFFRITSRFIRRKSLNAFSPSKTSVYCSDYMPELRNWPLFTKSIDCTQCSELQCERCRHWREYLELQLKNLNTRRQARLLSPFQLKNIDSLIAGIACHVAAIKNRNGQNRT